MKFQCLFHTFPVLANACPILRLRPPQQVVMRSAMPQLSRKVAGETAQPEQKNLAKAIISIRPRRITAALVLSPKPRPSQNPAPTATMFCVQEKKSQTSYVLLTFTAIYENVLFCCSGHLNKIKNKNWKIIIIFFFQLHNWKLVFQTSETLWQFIFTF